jgi:DNA repair photolyase
MGEMPLDIRRTKGEYHAMLIGIAKMAAESVTLQSKRQVEYRELEARTILNRTKPSMPFHWTINPYRGCEFGCVYCYARYTHEFMEQDPAAFEDLIYAKAGAAALLAHDLRKADRRETIAIGTATDPYQPAERKFGKMREMLTLLSRERGRRIAITTKSDLVTRDIDLLTAIAQSNLVSVNMTVTTLDAKLARILEPRAPRPDLRIEAIRRLSAAGITTGVANSPVLPLINDSERSLGAVAKAARDAGAKYFWANVLFLRPASRGVFFAFLEKNFPHLVRRYQERYENAIYLKGSYVETIRDRVLLIRERYGLDNGAPKEPEPEPEPTLFALK